MSNPKSYSNYEINQLQEKLKELSDLVFKQILKESKYENFLDQETFEKYRGVLGIRAHNRKKIEEVLESLKED